MVAVFGFGAELAHENGLLREGPVHAVGVLRAHLVPADVLVTADDVERVAERIVVDHLCPSDVARVIAEVIRRVGSSLRASLARSVRNLVRVGLLGVSLETDHRMTEALLRSRRIISCSIATSLA